MGKSSVTAEAPIPRKDWPASAVTCSVERWTRELPKTSPDFDEARPYVPRLERPEEWTTVGLVGQVPIRVAEAVKVGDYLAASEVPGVATSAGSIPEIANASSLEVMRIDQAFDEVLGYAIAWVLIGAV